MESPERLSTLTRSQLDHIRSLDFARWAWALHRANGFSLSAAKLYAARWPKSLSTELITKAAADAATTSDPLWASPLSTMRPLSDAFVALTGAASLIGRIPLRRVPFNTPIAVANSLASFGWVGEGAPKPVSEGSFATVRLGPAKAAGVIAVSRELIDLTTPGSEVALRDAMVTGVTQFLDRAFVDPALAASPANPASITNGITPIAGTGDIAKDVASLIAAFTASNPGVESMVLLMTPATASALAMATNSPTLTLSGGSVFGVTVVVSASVGPRVVVLDPGAVLLADDGRVELDLSEAATLQMNDAPTSPDATTVLVSLWQSNLVGIRAERYIRWERARASAVAYLALA